MTQREKLIELIDDYIYDVNVNKWYSEELDEGLADNLLANGVIVDIHCPCGLREDMEEGDCEKTDCDKCCPLAERSEGK